MSVMVITTCLVTLVMVLVWNVRLWLAAAFFGFFFVFEMIILSANVYKVNSQPAEFFVLLIKISRVLNGLYWSEGCSLASNNGR